MESGASLEQVKQGRPTKDWDKRLPKSFVTSDRVMEEAYDAVTGERAH